jgi:hypothetical protein
LGQHRWYGLTGALKFGHVTSNAQTEFQNSININGATRTINIADNPVSTADLTTISGAVSDGSVPGGILKTGAGTLIL